MRGTPPTNDINHTITFLEPEIKLNTPPLTHIEFSSNPRLIYCVVYMIFALLVFHFKYY